MCIRDRLQPGTLVTGPVLARLANRLPAGVVAVPDELWQLQAASVAQLASMQFAQGRRDDVWNLVPYYGRLSAAEEKQRDAS